MFCQSASSISKVGVRLVMPAQFNRISTPPNLEIVFSKTCSREPRSPTSEVTASERRPSDSICAAVSFTCSARRDVATTSAPASASPNASAWPIPEVPPTTTATLPLTSSPLIPLVAIRYTSPTPEYRLQRNNSQYQEGMFVTKLACQTMVIEYLREQAANANLAKALLWTGGIFYHIASSSTFSCRSFFPRNCQSTLCRRERFADSQSPWPHGSPMVCRE